MCGVSNCNVCCLVTGDMLGRRSWPQEHSTDPTCVIGSKARPGRGPAPRSVGDAVFELMNNPHPLDILGDSAAYGPTGQVSRYHNPDNYTRALGGVLRSRGSAWQRLRRHALAAGMRWHVPTLDSAQPDQGSSKLQLRPALCQPAATFPRWVGGKAAPAAVRPGGVAQSGAISGGATAAGFVQEGPAQ